MRRPGIALLALALLAALFALTPAQPADAQQTSQALVSNFGQFGDGTFDLRTDLAQSFTTGGNPDGYTLTSVDVMFARSIEDFSSKLTVTVNSDSNGRPGTVVATLTNPAFVNRQRGTYSWTHEGVELTPGSRYWVVFDQTGIGDSTTNIDSTTADGEDSGAAPGWSIHNLGHTRAQGGNWQGALDASSLKIRINGAINPSLVSNFNQANGQTGGFSNDHAQAFTTGSSAGGYILTAVHFQFPTISDGGLASKLTVTVNSDSGGNPGAVVATLTNPSPMASGTNSFTHSGLFLHPDVTYWVVIDLHGSGASGTNTVQNTASAAEDSGAAPGWSIAAGSRYRNWNLPGASWIPFGEAKKIQISGTVVKGTPLVRNADGSYTVPFDWALKPAGLGEGEVFRLLFITEDMRDATSANIADYDAFVRDAARKGHTAIQLYADQFRVVGSTGAVDARTHTRTDPNRDWDAPIYWVNGKRVAANNAGFWSSTWENWAMSDRRYETGEQDTGNDWPWTGTQADGTKHATDPLGNSPNVTRGRFWTGSGDTGPIDYNRAAATQDHSLYGMSPRFRVDSTRFADPAPGGPVSLSNLGEADGAARAFSPLSSGRPDLAQSFRTGANGSHYRLRSVDVEFARVGDSGIGSKVRVQIWADSGGNPDRNRVLATLANPSMSVSSSDRTYTFTYAGDGPGLKLEAGATYWVVVMDRFLNLSGVNSIRATASDAERLQGLPEGWSIGDGSRHQATVPVPASSWSTHNEALKIGLNLVAADPFVQFRTCAGTVSGNNCSAGWVVFNYNRHDPPPTITLVEGGDPVTYQWRAVDPHERRYLHVVDQVETPRVLRRSRGVGLGPIIYRDHHIGPGDTDRDRLICHTGKNHGGPLGDPIGEINAGSSAGTGLDRHSGCPFVTQFIYEDDPNKWRPVTIAAGQDSDAFDHYAALRHSPNSVGHNFYEGGVLHRAVGFDYPSAQVNLVIRDDDEWEQDLVFSVDDGATWTSLEDGGLSLAFPPSLGTGVKAHYFWVRLKNDPATLGDPTQTKRFFIDADGPARPDRWWETGEWGTYRVWLSSPAADHRHSFRKAPDRTSAGSVFVSYTPVQVEINVGDGVSGTVLYDWEVTRLYERNDNQISTATPPATVRTDSFTVRGVAGSCVGCQLLPGDLPDPVVERVGDLTFANLSDTGIDLSWPLVVGAEGYEVRYWSTTSPFAGDPNVPPHRPEDVYTGVEPKEPRWNIRNLEPDTEYRAQVFYRDHGATQLSTASPVIRFTTLSAGAPVQAEPTSVVVERVPEVSISVASGTITEGEDATFTVSVEPAPEAPLDVQVRVIAPAAGSVVASRHLGTRTVAVGTGGSATFTIPTVDDAHWDSNGMLRAGVQFGEGYRKSTFKSSASVYIANNDLPPPPAVQRKGVSDTTATIAWKPQAEGARYLVVWHRAFAGIPVLTEVTTTATEYQITGLDPSSFYTVSVLAGGAQLGKLTVKTLAAGAAPQTFTVNFETPAPNTSLPVISVTADGDVTEGEDASFTVTANPAPAADLDVSVTVSQDGDYGAVTGQRTVTIPAAGYATLTVATDDDTTDEAQGSVTVTIDADPEQDDYLVSTSQGAATAAVSDNDDSAHTVDPDVIAKVRELAGQTQHGTAHVNRWNRVLVAFGEHDGTGVTGGAMTASEAQDMADRHSSPVWDEVVVELTALEAAQAQTPPPPPTPEVNVTGAGGGTEGDPVTFTVTASPAPAADLAVSVTVATTGDFGYGPLPTSVTIPASGSATVTVTTTDDSTDEADGSVTLTLNAGSGYTVGALSTETASVTDDDETVEEQTGYTVDPDVIAKVRELAGQTQHGTAHVNRWNRVLVAFGEHDGTGVTGGAMTASEAQDMADRHSSPVWDEVVAELTALEAASQQTPPPPPTPVVSVSGGNGITEGGSASFTVTASPAPAADLTVSVTVSQSGDYGAATGQRTVTVPTSGSVSFTVGTTDDAADEADGSVTATVNAGSGYTVSATQGAATVAVSDNDNPKPVVSVTGGNGVTEGGDATFTVSASPAPASNLAVSVTVSQSGDYGAATGKRTVTVPTSGSVSFTVGTTDDTTDEADGSVTATVDAGSGYTVSSSQGAATVGVADNDNPKPVVSVTGGNGVTEGGDATFTVTASPAPASNLAVSVTVSQSGDYGAATGKRTVTVPTTGSVTLTVGTTDDTTDEADGSVTATVNAGSGYTVSSSQGAATVGVADNDDAAPEVEITVTVEDASAVEGDVLVFRVLLSEASTEEVRVRWYTSPAYHLLDDRAHRSDYQASEGELVFAPGETELTAEVWLEQDDDEEPDEYFAVEAFLPGSLFLPNAVGTMTIVDDD